MFCTSCNADIGTRLPNFCPQCGVPLQADNLLEFVSPAPATATQDDDATVLLPPRKAAKTSRKPTAATSAPDEDTTVLLPPHGAAKAPQDLIDALLAPDDDSTALAHETAETPQEPTAATSAPDNDATVLLPPRGAAKAPQDPLDALLAPDDDSSALTHEAAETPQESADATSAPDDDATVLLPPRGAAKAPQDPLDALLAPDEDSTALAHEAAETPQEPADATSIPDNSPTVQLFSRLTPGLLQNSTPAPPSQPDASINASTAPTMAISGSNTKRRKKKPKKARGRAQSSAPKPLIEPFIGATQAEPVSPFNKPEPSLSTESFPPVFPEKSDRIVVEPLYPGSSPYPGSLPYPGSSRIPTQVIRESIPPAAIGLAAIILIVFLGGLWWWNSGETVSFPEDVGEPPPMSEPLPKAVSSPPPSTPASPAENTAAFSPEEQPPGLESGLMSIPSLPANQQQGRHNQYNPATTKDDPLPSVSPAPMPEIGRAHV
jgi:hypothetical protein